MVEVVRLRVFTIAMAKLVSGIVASWVKGFLAFLAESRRTSLLDLVANKA
jgi:hypothetical protein